MKAEEWKQLRSLCNQARQLNAAERSAFLTAACQGDERLRGEVESLLEYGDMAQAGNFLEKPALASIRPSLKGGRIAHYQVGEMIGAGGMGEVYRARDSKLGRDVAIKVLPASLALDPERLLRFEREARVLAALNHPHIAAIYGLENADGVPALVLELVEGPTLADRVSAGPIPIREASALSRQIAEALEAAHAKGIIHRDLKAANIKIACGGMVKVLDFGLAKAFSGEGSESDLSKSPKVTTDGEGRFLGTPAYMSPEQARGQSTDKRTDVWAFGCVLYQMLTGRVPFVGETVSDTIAAILAFEPDWSALPEATPASIRRLLRRCLEKDSKRRLHDIADARIEIEDAISSGENDRILPAAFPQRGERRWRRAAVVSFAACIAAVAILVWRSTVPTSAPPEIQVEVSTPSTGDPFSFAISPDGRRLVFAASNEGKPQLWVRPLDSVLARPLTGTDGGTHPFWSPDSASVGFFADGKLKRIDVVGGAPQVLANAHDGRGGTWNREGTIVFSPNAATGPLLRVPASGGEPVAVTRLEPGQGNHRFPQFLPDGRHFIYFGFGGPAQGVYAGSLDGGPSKRLANADAAAVVSPSGFLLFQRQTTLFAQTFDFKRQELYGNPFPLGEQVPVDPTLAPAFSTTSGIVAYRSGSAGVARQLTWLDRAGKRVGNAGAPDTAGLNYVELSPDGKRVAVDRTVNGNTDIWLMDIARGVPTRFTFGAAKNNTRSVWSPDGSRIVFDSNRKGSFNLYWKSSGGTEAEELLLESDQNPAPNDWSSDGKFILFCSMDPQTGWDLWVLPLAGDKKQPFLFLKTAFEERNGQFSPDGKWIAYQSDESGRFEIYVQPFPGPGRKFQISASGGEQPRWNKNGKEIFYVSLDNKMMAAQLKLSSDGQSLETGTPAALFPVRIAGGPPPGPFKQEYAVSSDGQRFLVDLAADESAASPITLIYNWKPKP